MGSKFRAGSQAGTAQQQPAYLSVGGTPALPPTPVSMPTPTPNPSAASTPRHEEPGGKSWPSSLRAYVERTFHKCVSDAERKTLQVHLKALISQAQAAGELWTRDWASMPLPGDAVAAFSTPQVKFAPTAPNQAEVQRRVVASLPRPQTPSDSDSSPERRGRGRRSRDVTPSVRQHSYARIATAVKYAPNAAA